MVKLAAFRICCVRLECLIVGGKPHCRFSIFGKPSLLRRCLYRLIFFNSFGIAVDQLVWVRAQQDGEAHQFLHHVDDPVVVPEGFIRPTSSNSWHALATDDWLGMVNIRIQRPSIRS